MEFKLNELLIFRFLGDRCGGLFFEVNMAGKYLMSLSTLKEYVDLSAHISKLEANYEAKCRECEDLRRRLSESESDNKRLIERLINAKGQG
ncbi:hypothetical protein LMG33818_000924 [Halomonadaceae bacterium LMG 33818]